jgi:Na+(H+)/acetate symporter ActP
MGTGGFPHPPTTMGLPPVSDGSKEAPNSTIIKGGQVIFNVGGAGVVVPAVVDVVDVTVVVDVMVVLVVVVPLVVLGGGGSGVNFVTGELKEVVMATEVTTMTPINVIVAPMNTRNKPLDSKMDSLIFFIN